MVYMHIYILNSNSPLKKVMFTLLRLANNMIVAKVFPAKPSAICKASCKVK